MLTGWGDGATRWRLQGAQDDYSVQLGLLATYSRGHLSHCNLAQREFINILEGVRLRKATHALLIAVRALLTLLFLFLLLRKMQGHLQTRGGYPWILILAPLYTGNFLRIGPSLFSGSHFYPDTSLHFTPTIAFDYKN